MTDYEWDFVIPANGAVGIANFQTYTPFVNPTADVYDLCDHFLDAMSQKDLFIWGTGASANWRINIKSHIDSTEGFRECTGWVRSSSEKLYLTSYEELAAGAHLSWVTLPRIGTDRWYFELPLGEYKFRVIQMYDPLEADSSTVFERTGPHFLVQFERSNSITIAPDRVPWFPPGPD